MLIVDLIIIGLLVWAAVAGYKHGFILVALSLAGLVVSIIAAELLYRPLSSILSTNFHVFPSLSGVLAYGLLITIMEAASLVPINLLIHKLPPHVGQSTINSASGAILNALKDLGFITIGLIVFSGLPISASQKDAVTGARIPQALLSYSGGLQSRVNQALGSSVTDLLNFLTVKPESEESVELGFKTTNVKVDEAAEARMLDLVNHERAIRGLKALKINLKARDVARTHSIDMFARGYFSHIDPEGNDPFDRMKAGGVRFNAAGENLALAPTLDQAHQGLMNSPGHRANILSPDFSTVGIGVIDGGRYGLMITQDFTD